MEVTKAIVIFTLQTLCRPDATHAFVYVLIHLEREHCDKHR